MELGASGVSAARRSCWRRRSPARRRGAGGWPSPRRPGAGRRARRRRTRRPRRRRARRAPGRGSSRRSGPVSRSMPPVSTSVKLRPFHSVSISLRSRVIAGALVHDGLARAGEAVDERGLADVRVADDRDLRTHVLELPGLVDEADDPVHDLVGSARSCPSSRRRGRRERRCLALAVTRIALGLLGEDRSDVRSGSAARRRARSCGQAVRNTLRPASGATTVPMSRPSATQSPAASMRRCLRDHRPRTSGSAAHARCGRTPARGSPRSRPRRRAARARRLDLDARATCGRLAAVSVASAAQRYIAPVSRYVKPSAPARRGLRLTSPLPRGRRLPRSSRAVASRHPARGRARLRVEGMDSDAAISISGLVKTFGHDPGARRPRPRGRPR